MGVFCHFPLGMSSIITPNIYFTLANTRAAGQSKHMVRSLSLVSRLRWRRRFRSLGALLLLVVFGFAAWVWFPSPSVTVPLVHVIDGDSLTVRQDGTPLTIRLTGIDAAEYRQDCEREGARWSCGHDARTALEKLAGRGPPHCEVAAKDRYNRTLAACRTAPYPDGVDLGAEMVRQGWAVATSDAYMVEEAEAQARRRGIWQGDFMRPENWRATHERPATALTPPDL